MAMGMLEAGGLEVMTDGVRAADDSNPAGLLRIRAGQGAGQGRRTRSWLEERSRQGHQDHLVPAEGSARHEQLPRHLHAPGHGRDHHVPAQDAPGVGRVVRPDGRRTHREGVPGHIRSPSTMLLSSGPVSTCWHSITKTCSTAPPSRPHASSGSWALALTVRRWRPASIARSTETADLVSARRSVALTSAVGRRYCGTAHLPDAADRTRDRQWCTRRARVAANAVLGIGRGGTPWAHLRVSPRAHVAERRELAPAARVSHRSG